ncbi:hypothetical protein Tco_1474466 [Tanacetum coccineum]
MEEDQCQEVYTDGCDGSARWSGYGLEKGSIVDGSNLIITEIVTFGVGRGRLVAASANRVFGPKINCGGIKNGGGRRHDMPNMCGSDHGRSGNFRQGRGDVGEHGRGQGKKCGVDKSVV